MPLIIFTMLLLYVAAIASYCRLIIAFEHLFPTMRTRGVRMCEKANASSIICISSRETYFYARENLIDRFLISASSEFLQQVVALKIPVLARPDVGINYFTVTSRFVNRPGADARETINSTSLNRNRRLTGFPDGVLGKSGTEGSFLSTVKRN